jgi:hypothetical protein
VIKPGETKTKEYLVKVTSTKDAEVIENKACFTGDSEVNDNHQEGCDTANVKVSVPKEEPKPVPKPEQPQPQTPAAATPITPVVASAELPKTGASDMIAPLAAFTSGTAAYAGRLLVIKRRQK